MENRCYAATKALTPYGRNDILILLNVVNRNIIILLSNEECGAAAPFFSGDEKNGIKNVAQAPRA